MTNSTTTTGTHDGFDVQTASPTLDIDAGVTGRIKFSVRNLGAETRSVVATIIAIEPTPSSWTSNDHLSIDRPSRILSPGGSDDVVVTALVPPGTPPGTYPFELHVASTDGDAVQMWGQSPRVTATIRAVEVPAPPSWPKWSLLAAAVVLGLIVGVVGQRVLRDQAEWTQQQATAVPFTVRLNGAPTAIGIIPDGLQEVSVTPGQDQVGELSVSLGPFVVLTPRNAGEGEGAHCAAALDAQQPVLSSRSIPIDGRRLCVFIGEGEIGVLRIVRLTSNAVTMHLDSWRLV